jgi:RNA polymerase sigma-70 factor (ECF subfamily)
MSHEMSTPRLTDAEEAYGSHGRELWALFYSQCSDPELARDALHEAFLRLCEYRGTPIADHRAWLLTVGRNWLRDAARRKKTAANPSDILDSLQGSQLDAETQAISLEMREGVRHALKALRPEDREALVFRYALGWSSERIAIATESTAAASDMRLSRARRRLARILESRGVTHEHV